MSVHSNPIKVFVSNSLVANTGTSIPTIANNDVLITDRALALLSSDTASSDKANDLIYIAVGTGAVGEAKTVAIPTKGIRKITTSVYSAPVQHKITLNAAAVPATSDAGTNFNIKVYFHDTNRQMDDAEGRAFFTYKSVAADEDAATIYTGLAAKINAVTYNKQVTATVVGSTLEIVGLPVTDNAFGLPQFRYFSVALRSGFLGDATGATTVTPGQPGKGVGSHVKHLELSGMYDFNRTQWPIHTDTRRATGSYYNLVTIEYATTNMSAFNRLASNLQSLVVAFTPAEGLTAIGAGDGEITAYDGSGTAHPSFKQKEFVAQLASIAESVGVYVS